MTFRPDIASAPLARLTVTIMGSISGVRPTATATANSSASSQLPLVRPLIRNTRGAITTMKPSINQVNRMMPLSKLVSTRCLAIALATRPKAVRGPVSATTPQPMPLTTALPMKQMLGRSNGVSAVTDVGGSELLERHRLAGERRLVNEEVLRRDQPEIGGDHVARRQQDDIAGHELLNRHINMIVSLATRLPTHGRSYRHHPLQLIGGIVGTMFLNEAQRDTQYHHDGNHDRGTLVAQEVGRSREREQK